MLILGENIIDRASLGTLFVILLFFVKRFRMYVFLVQIIIYEKFDQNNNVAYVLSKNLLCALQKASG